MLPEPFLRLWLGVVTESVSQIDERSLPAPDYAFESRHFSGEHLFDIGLIVAGCHVGFCLRVRQCDVASGCIFSLCRSGQKVQPGRADDSPTACKAHEITHRRMSWVFPFCP